MPKTGIPSPARSQGGAFTPRRYRPRGPRSVGSPARSDVSARLTSVINMHNKLVVSPAPSRRSVLADTTDIEEPKRRSWWRQLGENSREVMEVIESNKATSEIDNVEELIEMEVLSQEKRSYNLDLPESSGSESIHSIIMPQRKLLKQKENEPQKMFGQIMGNRETLPKLHKTSAGHDKSINAGPRELFHSNKQRNKPVFPAALLDVSLSKTLADKTKEYINEPPQKPVRNIFGNRAPTKRRNMFAEFVVSESEDEILEIQPKVFEFPKKSDPKRKASSGSRGIREPSPASSITTDMEMDDWRQLPSSTMVAEQLEEVVSGTPVKRPRLSKLSEVKESDTGTNSFATDGTKQSNRSVSKNRSKNTSIVKDKSFETNRSMTTRNAAKNKQTNICSDIALETSLSSKNSSNNKSKSSNSSLRKCNSKIMYKSVTGVENNNKTLEKSNQIISKSKTSNIQVNKTKQDTNLPNLLEHDEDNNADINDSNDDEEINFNLEYESDDQQETVAKKVDNKSMKNKTVTLRRDSNRGRKDITTAEEVDQNKTIDETENPKASKENNNIKTKDHNNVSTNNKVSNNANNKAQRNAHINKIINESNQMELDEQHQNVLDAYDEQMEVDEIDEVVKDKEITNNTMNKSTKNIKVKNQKQHDCQEDRATQQLSHENNCEQIGNGENRNDIAHRDIENDHEMQHAVIMKEPNKNTSYRHQESQNIRDTENTAELSNNIINSSEHQDLNQHNTIPIPNHKSKVETHKLNGIENHLQNINETLQPNVSRIQIQSENETEKLNIPVQSIDDKQNDSDKENQQNESQVEQQNESEEEDEQNVSQVEQQNESKDEDEQNECQVELENKNEEEDGQNESQVEKQNESEEEDERNESQIEQQDESEEEDEQNESQVEQENENEEEQNESQVEQQNESEEEDEQNESQIEQQDESEEEDEQYKSQVEQQDESEEEDEQNKSQLEQQDESEEEDEQSESQVEQQDESEEEVEQNESQVEQQDESEEEQQNELEENNSDVEEHNECEEEEDDNESEPDKQIDVSHDENQEEISILSQGGSADVIEHTETSHSSKIKSPEAVLHDKTKRGDSSIAQGRNTSVRKSKSIIKPLNIRPSLAPHRDSTGFSDGTRNSSAEGSGWDSHRTTRKTLRKTLGRDFSPRKSLRALVMEKAAKRQTAFMDGRAEMTSLPLANSTEFPEMSNRCDEETMESDHELSRRTRQATLEMCLEQIKKKNLERWERVGEKVRHMFSSSYKENARFKEPRPMYGSTREKKQVKPKKMKQLCSLMPMEYLPPEIVEDMKYKPPKRFKPSNVSWITNRLYKFLETKLEPKYDYKARVRAEKLVESIYNFAKGLKRQRVAAADAVDDLKHEMARLDIVKTHFDFDQFFRDYMPREVRIKVIPDIVNKIPMPRNGIFSDIIC